MITGICPLFDNKTEIRKSHIFPKFVYKDLKWNNNSKFVNSEVRCVPKQDGFKEYLLGKEAEELFSKYENLFAKQIYRPFRKGELKGIVRYDDNLYYFLVLQIWRTCLFSTRRYGRRDFAEGLYDTLIDAQDEWKHYLTNKMIPLKYHEFYLMPIDTRYVKIPRFLETDFYIRRSIEFNIMVTETEYAVYCKFPSFFIWAPLCQHPQINYGFRINPESGEFDLSHYMISDHNILDYLLYKIDKVVEWRKQMALYNPQKIKNNQAKMANDKEFQKSELAEILSMPSLSEMQLSGEEFTMSFLY
jgi:hypothetical protein